MMNDTLYLGIPIQGSQGMISGWHGVRANGAPTGEILLNPVTFPVIPPLFCQVRIPGKDIGILSYNEIPLKKIAANGISVISTDFSKLGTHIAEMVITRDRITKYNSFHFIDRKSF